MGKDEAYPNERTAARILELAFPDADVGMRESVAYFVSQRTYTIDEGMAKIQAREVSQRGKSLPPSSVPSIAPAARASAPKSKDASAVPAHLPYTKATATPTTAPRSRPSAANQSSPGSGLEARSDDPDYRIIHNRESDARLIHYFYGDNAENYDHEVLGEGGQCILFTTSMTGDRRVRDHCRKLETLLYVKQIPHHVMDVADNAFLKRKARTIFRDGTGKHTMPNMPLLCVDNRYVGGYEEVQDLEDCGHLNSRLMKLGFNDPCLHKARPDYFDADKKDENFSLMPPAATATATATATASRATEETVQVNTNAGEAKTVGAASKPEVTREEWRGKRAITPCKAPEDVRRTVEGEKKPAPESAIEEVLASATTSQRKTSCTARVTLSATEASPSSAPKAEEGLRTLRGSSKSTLSGSSRVFFAPQLHRLSASGMSYGGAPWAGSIDRTPSGSSSEDAQRLLHADGAAKESSRMAARERGGGIHLTGHGQPHLGETTRERTANVPLVV